MMEMEITCYHNLPKAVNTPVDKKSLSTPVQSCHYCLYCTEMTMSPVPTTATTNYAEQVLREEAERIAELKKNAAAAQLAVAEAKNAAEVSKEVKVNLKDEDDFPTLGKAKGKYE